MSDCYLLTQKGTLMPSTYVGLTDSGMCEVTSPNGTAYTANPGNVVSAEDGAQMLRQRRAEQLVADGYQVMHLRGDRWHVWCLKKHGVNGNLGGYVVTLTDGCEPVCNCPDTNTVGIAGCKHAMGALELLKLAQVTKPTVRVMANAVVLPTPRRTPKHSLAEMIVRDGWS